ncbi:MAG: hypothetical protein U9P14_10180, partial [Gemmatimonadota bacterium]|nr:hypothetical protein [Gemmatimonadota bacterium]
YKLAFGSLYSIRDTVLKVASYNSAIHFFIISGLVYCISNCSFVIMIPLLCFLGALISLNWSKVDRDQNKSLECQELICKAIEEDLPCVLISTGSELKDIYCKKRLIEKLFDKIPISRLSIALFLIYLSIFVVSLIWLLLDCYNFKKFFLFLAV